MLKVYLEETNLYPWTNSKCESWLDNW
jgi:hypothetical protein